MTFELGGCQQAELGEGGPKSWGPWSQSRDYGMTPLLDETPGRRLNIKKGERFYQDTKVRELSLLLALCLHLLRREPLIPSPLTHPFLTL